MAGISRRAFLGGAAAAGAGAALAVALPQLEGSAPAGAAPLHGVHQAGTVQPTTQAVAVLALDVVATSRTDLMDLFQTITSRARLLVAGGVPENLGPG